MTKVWIELPKVDSVEEAQLHCDQANKMLNKLGCAGTWFWATADQKWERTFYNIYESGMPSAGYTELRDRGKWFNLEFLAS